jgi:putative transposase
MRREPGRPDIRLANYDYSSAGGYYITLCAENRTNQFGEIIDGEMILNPEGDIVFEEWERSTELRPHMIFDEFVIMPNHMHAVVWILDKDTSCAAHSSVHLQRTPRVARSLGSFVAGFKATTTRRIKTIQSTPRVKIWQANFYEHIIRNEPELQRIRDYIIGNPAQWAADKENPDCIS